MTDRSRFPRPRAGLGISFSPLLWYNWRVICGPRMAKAIRAHFFGRWKHTSTFPPSCKNGPVVQRSRHRVFIPATGVRLSAGSPKKMPQRKLGHFLWWTFVRKSELRRSSFTRPTRRCLHRVWVAVASQLVWLRPGCLHRAREEDISDGYSPRGHYCDNYINKTSFP